MSFHRRAAHRAPNNLFRRPVSDVFQQECNLRLLSSGPRIRRSYPPHDKEGVSVSRYHVSQRSRDEYGLPNSESFPQLAPAEGVLLAFLCRWAYSSNSILLMNFALKV